jgi:hypothetical protein
VKIHPPLSTVLLRLAEAQERYLALVEHQPSPGTVTGFRVYADGNLRSALANALQHARERWPNAGVFDIVACDKLPDPQPGTGIGWSAPALRMEEPRTVVTFSVG